MKEEKCQGGIEGGCRFEQLTSKLNDFGSIFLARHNQEVEGADLVDGLVSVGVERRVGSGCL